MQDLVIFATAASAIVLEAAPFLLLGSLIGALIEVLVSEQALLRCIPKNALGQVAVGLFAGMLLPTCECGIVPVARRLLLKNVPPRTAIPYMMAAPVVNPVVIASTLFAFQGDLSIIALRLLLVLVPATALGLALGDARPADVLRQRPTDLKKYDAAEAAHLPSGHDHGPGCACGCGHHDHNKLLAILRHTAAEFLSMARFLVFGGVVAAAFKTFLPPEILAAFAGSPALAIAGLMLLAVLLSICSEADAFVAASFGSFPAMAKIAFMAVGAMVDLKLIPLFLAVFRRRVALALIAAPIVAVYAVSLALALGGVR
ncbi:permease [Pseudodesulfovibrio sp.]|uniref:permease n=1 Tax=Pseudodesulfovibrio sp. TaxID=2035812 RepID=UPI0026337DD2|nr:permease [Pseudodesulfovibrio sp.]MDD3310593.1 permease [Pseudodesulfovibrio sp.]